MRVLLLTHFYPPETHGGTQRYVADLAGQLLADGVDVRVIAGAQAEDRAGEEEETLEDGVRVTRLYRDMASPERLSGDVGSARILARIGAIARDFAPDIAHVHHWHALSRGLVPTLKATGARVFVTLHDLFTSCPRHFRMPDARSFCAPEVTLDDCTRCVHPDVAWLPEAELRRVLEERLAGFQEELAAADRVFTVSEAQRDFLGSLPGFRSTAITPLPIGIPDPGPAPAPPAPDPDRLRIVNWAGIDPRKGLHVLVAAVAGADRPDRFTIHVHGREGQADYMDELRRLGAGVDLVFHGPFADDERPSFAARNDLAVFPFLAFETYGLVVDEALRLGLPVLTSARGAPPSRLGGRGMTFVPGDALALRVILQNLSRDPTRLADMRRAEVRIGDFSRHVRELSALFEGARRAR